jgi:hypothetical protein
MVKLELSQDAFERLHQLSDGRGKQVRVSKQDLRLLLLDHSRTIRALEDNRVAVSWKESKE